MDASATRVPRRNFEGLFVHALAPTGDFARALREVGYEAESECEHYPLEVWRACLRVACRYACPDKTEAEAYRELGRRFVEGFGQTLVGRVTSTAMSVLGPERCMARFPSYSRVGRPDFQVRLEAVRAGEWRVHAEDPMPLPDFMAGVLEALLTLSRAERPQVSLVERTETRFTLHVRW